MAIESQLGTLQTVRTCLESAAEHASRALRVAGLSELISVQQDVRQLLAQVATEPARVCSDIFVQVRPTEATLRALSCAGAVLRSQGDSPPLAVASAGLEQRVKSVISTAAKLAKEDEKNYNHSKQKGGAWLLFAGGEGSFVAPQEGGPKRWSCCGAKEKAARGCVYTPPASLDAYAEAAFKREFGDAIYVRLDG